MVLVEKGFGNGKLNLEPMGGPAGTEGLADFCLVEFVPGGFFEGGAGEAFRVVDGELYVVLV